MTDMTQSTELLAFKRQKDGYKVTVKISLCICVVLSWDELKVRQNLLGSDYEIYIVCLLVATVYWHKSLQFVKKKSNITLLPSLFMILLDQWAVSVIILRLRYYFLPRAQAIGNGWGCLSYLSGVKISDLVPFTVSQTSVDYQRPSWYLVGCFSLNKIPEISFTKTTLIIWLEPQSTSIKEFLFLGFFNFLCLNCHFLGVDQSMPLPHG